MAKILEPNTCCYIVSDDDNIDVVSWLTTSADWLDPTKLHLQGQQHETKVEASSQSIISPGSICSFASRGRSSRKRKRKWKRTLSRSKSRMTISDDEASITSAGSATARTRRSATSITSSTLRLDSRHILTAVPPSARKRSSSPARRALTELQNASPPLRVCQPDVSVEEPAAVTGLRKNLIWKMTSEVIPQGLYEKLRAKDPDQLDASTHLFEDPEINHDPSYLESLWQTVDTIYTTAQRAYNRHQDESMWIRVVERVLGAAVIHSPILELYSIQTQAIDPALLPQHVAFSFAKKADLALFFSPDKCPDVRRIQQCRPELNLSQMMDPDTCRLPAACGLEVKEQGGDYKEAITQLGIWCAAGLERVRVLWALGEGEREKTRETMLRPFVGWTVVGHEWKLHIAWKETDGSVVMMGPWRLLSGSTVSHIDIILLLRLVQAVMQWQETEYWKWLSRDVLARIT